MQIQGDHGASQQTNKGYVSIVFYLEIEDGAQYCISCMCSLRYYRCRSLYFLLIKYFIKNATKCWGAFFINSGSATGVTTVRNAFGVIGVVMLSINITGDFSAELCLLNTSESSAAPL